MRLEISAVIWLPALAASAVINDADFSPEDVIERDVAILGGGASGSYAAVRLREDFGKSIVLVEAADHLGGHVDTYNDPATGNAYDYGVQSYIDYNGTRSFFDRMGVATAAPTRIPRTSVYADFSTGAALTDSYVVPNNTAAMARYLELARLYEPLLLPSFDNFPAPGDIPEDLLLPFGEFVAKHGLETAVPQMVQVTAWGIGDVLGTTTLYVMQAFGVPMALALQPALGLGYVPASRNNSELYGRIADLLGDQDVLYSSRAVRVTRDEGGDGGVRLVVRSGGGKKQVLVKAKRLLVTIEPTLQALAPLDLDGRETAVFEQWQHTRVFAAIVSHPSLPLATTLTNTNADAAPANYAVLPEVPYVLRFEHYGAPSNLFRALMVGPEGFEAADAKALAVESLRKLMEGGVVPSGVAAEELVFHAFADHRPMHLRVSREQLEDGFIQEQYALQGHRSTWYTGASWVAHFTNIVWAFTDGILPRLVEGL